MKDDLEYFAVRFANLADATKAVAAVQSLVDCQLGAAFRTGPLEARIYASRVEWEPVLFMSRGAKAAARLAGLRLPYDQGPLPLDPGQTSLLTIPRAPLMKAVDELEAASQRASDRAMRVLIVEDQPDTAQMLADLVELWGCRAAIAPTGRQAREVAARFHPRVVLLDLGLPDEHGYHVAKGLRQSEPQEINFVVVTGWSQPVDQALSHDAGIAHHLVKPVNPERLRAILDGYRSAA